GVDDLDFVASVRRYLEHLKERQDLAGYRIMRCKLGLRPAQLRDFHIMLEFEGLAQMDQAFDRVTARQDPVENLHYLVNSKVQDVLFALYRDFPDQTRVRGDEKF